MKVLLLGCNSFLSRSIFSRLNKMNCEILGISKSDLHKELREIIEQNRISYKKFKFHKLDIISDYENLVKIILNFNADIIIDALGEGMVNPSWNEPDKWVRTNVEYKIKLIGNLLEKSIFPNKYIRISTPEVYGSVQEPIRENHIYNPSTPYAVTHSTIDQLMALYFKVRRFPIIFARFANFYGPRQQSFRLIPMAFQNAIKGNAFPLEGDGKSQRTFIYKSDIENALAAVINSGKPGKVYHFGTDELVSIKSLVRMIYKIVNEKQHVNFIKIPARIHTDLKYKLDFTETTKKLGWKPQVMLTEGLNLTYESFLRYQ